MCDKFSDREDKDGVRLSFNKWPTNNTDSRTLSCPIGALYTPLKKIDIPQKKCYNEHDIIRCEHCKACLNCYCKIDIPTNVYVCSVCLTKQKLPLSYISNSKYGDIEELAKTEEYNLWTQNKSDPICVFVIDNCCSSEEHQALKNLIISTFSIIPPNTKIGLITFGNCISIHELVKSDFPRIYSFSGFKTYVPNDLIKSFGVSSEIDSINSNNIFVPFSEAEDTFNQIIEKLRPSKIHYSTPQGQKEYRLQRCTGVAMHMAVSLLAALSPHNGGQVFVFTSGPITKGPGTMAPPLRSDKIRQHEDLEHGKSPAAKISQTSSKFFSDLADFATNSNVTVNYISACFEESGLHELFPCIYRTGGWLLSGESWRDVNIDQTLQKYFSEVFHQSGSHMTIKIFTSPEIKINGCIGPCVSDKILGAGASTNEIGEGKTVQWKAAHVLPTSTLAFYFEIDRPKSNPIASGRNGIIQFETRYTSLETGESKLRVTSVAFPFKDFSISEMTDGFDQGAATVLLARYAMYLLNSCNRFEVQGYLDRTLVEFAHNFGNFDKGAPNTFYLPPNCNLLPQFMFHFRRSRFMNTFNSSPDLTASEKFALMVENTNNSLFMIEPYLIQYKLKTPPAPVLLDMQSLESDTILLLDTYFRVLVWTGSMIAGWRDNGYEELEEYSYLKEFRERPLEEAKELIKERFPTPYLITCDENSSLSRFLLARCNPSTQPTVIGKNGEMIEDEPSYSRYYAKLKERAVL